MQRMGTKARMAAAFLLALLITAVYFAFAYTEMPFIYDINDDVAMRNVAAGVITGHPGRPSDLCKICFGNIDQRSVQRLSGMGLVRNRNDWNYSLFSGCDLIPGTGREKVYYLEDCLHSGSAASFYLHRTSAYCSVPVDSDGSLCRSGRNFPVLYIDN